MRLIRFSISNYRSFKEEQEIVFDQNSNVTAIFGPNGSGKTNFFRAVAFFRDFIRTSTEYRGRHNIVEPFALTLSNAQKETKFLVQFEKDKDEYEYSFSLLGGKVTDEYLKRKDIDGSKTIYRRKSISTGRYSEYGFTTELLNMTREDALLITKAWENNNKEASTVFEFLEHLHTIAGTQPVRETSRMAVESPEFKEKVLKFLKSADLYIQNLLINEVNLPESNIDNLPEELKKRFSKNYDVFTTHFVYDEKNGDVIGVKPLSLLGQESNGTRRMYELAFPIIDTLEKGNILLIDEFELFLHPRECEYIVQLFKNKDTNKRNAQLIIMTHATRLMGQIGKNDIYLFGKNAKEATIIGKLPGGIRQEDKQIEKKYLKGFFGSIPRVREGF